MLHGFLNIDKPAGITSHDVVARVRRLAHQKRVGHAGTLDPAATGVLIVALGAATRLIEYVQEATAKQYLARVVLGTTTTTDDSEGEMTSTQSVPQLTAAALEQVLSQLRGPIMQVPPMYSALHHQGQRLHELARAGVTLDLPARPVTIERLDLIDWSESTVSLDVMCSKGTYIRSLARDIGAALACGAHLGTLRRTAVGEFTIAEAVPLAQLEAQPENLLSWLMPPELAVADWPRAVVDAAVAAQIRNGQPIALAELAGDRARVHTADGALLALVTRVEQHWKPEKVFSWI